MFLKEIKKKFTIACIGGMNVDRKFYAKDSLQYETSNPATSSVSVGGVARNIAENLGRLDERVTLFSVSGEDGDWEMIKQLSSEYMDLSFVKSDARLSTGNYTAILDMNGDLSIALADMEVFNHITINLLKPHEGMLKKMDCIIIDLNCPAKTVEYIISFGENYDIPVFIIPVSSPKMDRLPETLTSVDWLIVNKDETETFLQMRITDDESWKKAVNLWLEKGIQHVVITNGEQGVMAGAKDEKVRHFPAIPVPFVKDVTGAGDAFCAAVIHMWLHKYSFPDMIQAGLMNAHQTIMSSYTVRRDLTRENLLSLINEKKEGC